MMPVAERFWTTNAVNPEVAVEDSNLAAKSEDVRKVVRRSPGTTKNFSQTVALALLASMTEKGRVMCRVMRNWTGNRGENINSANDLCKIPTTDRF